MILREESSSSRQTLGRLGDLFSFFFDVLIRSTSTRLLAMFLVRSLAAAFLASGWKAKMRLANSFRDKIPPRTSLKHGCVGFRDAVEMLCF